MHTTRALGRLLALLSLTAAVTAAPAPAASSPATPAAASTPTFTEVAPAATPTVAYASDNANTPLWGPGSAGVVPEPIRGQAGALLLSSHNTPVELENPDLLAPPSTDAGTVCVRASSYVMGVMS
jgi:hypothetical protein